MPWKRCECSTHIDVAIVTSAFYRTPEQWQIDFVSENFGKLACFECGGEVKREDIGNALPYHVTAQCVTGRLRALGVI
jgi:hypothetical protein